MTNKNEIILIKSQPILVIKLLIQKLVLNNKMIKFLTAKTVLPDSKIIEHYNSISGPNIVLIQEVRQKLLNTYSHVIIVARIPKQN